MEVEAEVENGIREGGKATTDPLNLLVAIIEGFAFTDQLDKFISCACGQ